MINLSFLETEVEIKVEVMIEVFNVRKMNMLLLIATSYKTYFLKVQLSIKQQQIFSNSISSNNSNPIHSDNVWILDSRATHQLTNDSSHLGNSIPFPEHDRVTLGNGVFVSLFNFGHARLDLSHSILFLKNILHTQVTTNLVSICKLCEDNNIFIEFRSHSLFIKDKAKRKNLLKPIDKGLYKLVCDNGVVKDQVFSEKLLAIVALATSFVWHESMFLIQ